MRRLLAALLLVGCAHKPVPRPAGIPAPSIDALMAALDRRHQAVKTLELETRTTSWLGGDRVRATVLMLVDRQGRLRFDAEVPVQGLAASLAVHDGVFAQLDLQHHTFREGPACPANVAQLIPIPLLPDEVAAILLGDAALGRGAHGVDVGWDSSRGADVLAVERPTGKLWVTMKLGGEVLAVEGETSGGRWRVSFEDARIENGISLPGTIRFAEPGKSFDDGVEVKVKERIGVNRPLRPESFVLTAPAGFQTEKLGCR